MSFILTYNTLYEKTVSYLERLDETVTHDFDAWVKFAHDRIGRDANTQLFEVYISGTFTPGISVIPKPARWQNTITFNYGTGANIVTLGNKLGVDFSHTHTCYSGTEIACGRCVSCSNRIQSFINAGLKDPIKYAINNIPWKS